VFEDGTCARHFSRRCASNWSAAITAP